MQELREPLTMRGYLRRTQVWRTVLGIAIVHVLMIAAAGLLVRPSSDPVPSHYTIYFGIDLIGPWWYPVAFIIAVTVVAIASVVLSKYIEQRWKLGVRFLWLQLIVSLIYLLSSISIIITPLLFAT